MPVLGNGVLTFFGLPSCEQKDYKVKDVLMGQYSHSLKKAPESNFL